VQDGAALQTIAAFHPRPGEFATLRDAQLAVARRYGFDAWEQLSREVELRQLRHGNLAEQARRVIDHACLRYNGDDQAWRYARAGEWLQQLPALTQRDFHCALAAADLDAVQDFLRRDPTLATRNGGPRDWPPLAYVTYSRVEQNPAQAVAVARLLLDHGAAADAQVPLGSPGFTPITGAIGEGERGPVACIPNPCADELVTLLLDAGANVNQSQALYNTMLGHTLLKWLRLFVQRGLNASDLTNWSADNPVVLFDFLLSQVVLQGQLELVQFLLEHGANPDAVSVYNQRNCHANAQLVARSDIAELLLQHGAKPVKLGIDDQVRVACGVRDLPRAQALLRQHPQLLQDNELFRDCAMVDVATCLWLLDQGYDINTRNRNGQTVLHNYALWNDADAVRQLLARGADPDLQEYHYQATPLGLALHHHHWPVIDVLAPVANNLFDVCRVADSKRAALLLARDASLAQQRTPMGNTLLHIVSQARQDDPDYDASVATIGVLLQYGVDPLARNNQNKTPAQWYRQLGMDELADYLQRRISH